LIEVEIKIKSLVDHVLQIRIIAFIFPNSLHLFFRTQMPVSFLQTVDGGE
jgi:hypothetical protein